MRPARRHRLADVHRDANEEKLVQLAELLGAWCYPGPPLDLLVCHRGVWLAPVEIKIPEREGLVHEFTAAQQRFFTACRVRNAPWIIWRTEADVLKTLGARASV